MLHQTVSYLIVRKVHSLSFGNCIYNVSLIVNNEEVPRSEMHLGHLLHTKYTDNQLTEDAIKGFNKSFYGFMARFGTCNTSTKNRLFHQYCQSMYGSQLWLLTSQNVNKMYTKWRIYHRHVCLSRPQHTMT